MVIGYWKYIKEIPKIYSKIVIKNLDIKGED